MKLDPTLVITFLVSLSAPWLQEWVNDKLQLKGPKAFALTALFAAVIAFVSLVVTGGLSLDQFTPANFVPLFAEVFTVTQVVFQTLKDKLI